MQYRAYGGPDQIEPADWKLHSGQYRWLIRLDDLAAAHAYSRTGRTSGKIAISFR